MPPYLQGRYTVIPLLSQRVLEIEVELYLYVICVVAIESVKMGIDRHTTVIQSGSYYEHSKGQILCS